jgi:hypothetical protein
MTYETVLFPLLYGPHICLKQIIYILDNGYDHQQAFAYAAVMVISRLGSLIILIKLWNL